MTELHEMAKTSFELELGGRKFKLRCLTLEGVFALVEADVISQRVAHVQQIAKGLEGPDKIDYLARTTRELPTGQELQVLVTRRMGTVSGVRHVLFQAAKEDQPELTLDDVSGFVTEDNIEEIGIWLSRVIGFPMMSEDESDDDAGGSEKN